MIKPPCQQTALYARLCADVTSYKFLNDFNSFWRKGWDSNPRYPCRHAGFQDRCLKPLGHPSACNNNCLEVPFATCYVNWHRIGTVNAMGQGGMFSFYPCKRRFHDRSRPIVRFEQVAVNLQSYRG